MNTPKIKQSENDVKKAIKEYLEFNGWTVYRINNAGQYRGKNKDGKDRYSFAGDPGVADLYAIKPKRKPLWIETKATGKKPSDDQYEFGGRANETEHTDWIWADSFEMFLSINPNMNKATFNDIKNNHVLPKGLFYDGKVSETNSY